MLLARFTTDGAVLLRKPGQLDVRLERGDPAYVRVAKSIARHAQKCGLLDEMPADTLEAFAVPTVSEIAAAGRQTDRNPSHGRRRSGNYAKGKIRIHGLQITIENAKGSTRRGISHNGKPWEMKMLWPYGYISQISGETAGAVGADDEHLDCFLGPHPKSELIFVVDQNRADESFDEHKIFIGWTNAGEVKQAYLAHYAPGWKGFAGVKAMTLPDFKRWVEKGKTRKPVVVTESLQESAATATAPAKPGFTGIDSHGHKWQNGKQVKVDQDQTTRQPPTAKLHGEDVKVVARDSTHGLVRVKTSAGDKVVNAHQLDFSTPAAPPPSKESPGPGQGDSIPVGEVAAQTYHYLHDTAAAGFAKLPAPVQKAVSTALAVAFTGWTASQKLAERISIEKGNTPEQAAQNRSVMAAWDVALFKPVALATAPLGGAIAAATWIVPPVTGVYLAHAAVRHPIATFRAAKGLLSDAVKGVKNAVADHTQTLESAEKPSDPHKVLADALERNKYDDWYSGLLHAALEETKDAAQAVKIADQIYAQHPKDTSTPKDDDADVLFGGEKTRAD